MWGRSIVPAEQEQEQETTNKTKNKTNYKKKSLRYLSRCLHEKDIDVEAFGALRHNQQEQREFQSQSPWRLSDDQANTYKAHQKQLFDISSVAPLVFISYITIATRANLQHEGSSNFLFSIAFSMLVLGTAIFSLFVFAHLCKYNWRKSHVSWKEECAIRSEKFLLKSFCGRIEDVLGLLANLMAVFFLIARVKFNAI